MLPDSQPEDQGCLGPAVHGSVSAGPGGPLQVSPQLCLFVVLVLKSTRQFVSVTLSLSSALQDKKALVDVNHKLGQSRSELIGEL